MTGILNGPNDSQMEAIRQELKEDPERFKHNLQLFEEWIATQPHLPKNYGKQHW